MNKLNPSENVNYKQYVINRIMGRTEKQSNGCVEYIGKRTKPRHPYGVVSVTWRGKSKNIPVHRALYMARHDLMDLPRSTQIRHKCDNPRCVNLEHLEPGSAKDNSRDMLERGRQRRKDTYKPHTRQCKLTNEQVLDIKYGTEKPKYYCWKYRITDGYVSKLRNGTAKPLIVK